MTDMRIPIPLREVYRWGADLEVPLEQRGDIHAINDAVWAQDPTHPGFRLKLTISLPKQREKSLREVLGDDY